MNKRKYKKKQKKSELFAINFVSSYKELKQIDRSYHEFVLNCNRMKRRGHRFEW